MDGKKARQQAAEYAKQAIKTKNIFNLLADVQDLIETLKPQRQAELDKYFTDELDKHFTEAWRLEKAINSLEKSERILSDRYWAIAEITNNRITRKREKKILKGWIAA